MSNFFWDFLYDSLWESSLSTPEYRANAFNFTHWLLKYITNIIPIERESTMLFCAINKRRRAKKHILQKQKVLPINFSFWKCILIGWKVCVKRRIMKICEIYYINFDVWYKMEVWGPCCFLRIVFLPSPYHSFYYVSRINGLTNSQLAFSSFVPTYLFNFDFLVFFKFSY